MLSVFSKTVLKVGKTQNRNLCQLITLALHGIKGCFPFDPVASPYQTLAFIFFPVKIYTNLTGSPFLPVIDKWLAVILYVKEFCFAC